jgi:hypothetical protein
MNIQDRDRIEEIRKLDLPNNLFDEIFGESASEKIKGYLSEPSAFYTQGWPDNSGYFPELNDKALLPLWECSTSIYAVDISDGKREFIQFYVEFPDEYEVIGNSIYLALLAVIDSEFDAGAIDHELVSLISLFQMPKPNELYNLLTSGEELDDHKQQECGAAQRRASLLRS